MSADWYIMDKPPIYNGGFEGEEFLSYAQNGFQEMLDTTMLCDNVEFINSDFSEIISGKAVIQSVTPDTQLKAEDRQILVPIGTLSGFAYIRFDDEIWIIASEPSNNKFYEKAILKICHNQLRWQDVKTKEIFSYWYWCEDTTRYSSGVFKGNVVVSYEKQYGVLLPKDNNTKNLCDGMRFMLELSNNTPLVYKLTKFDGITANNKNMKLLKIVLTQTVYDEDVDNVDLMIADYYEAKDTSNGYNCKIHYDSSEISLSSFGKFDAVFLDKDNNILNNVDFYWKITNNSFDIGNLKCSYQDNTIKIVVTNNNKLIGENFDLNIVSPDDVILATLTVTITALW